jgi:hypothetical protein
VKEEIAQLEAGDIGALVRTLQLLERILMPTSLYYIVGATISVRRFFLITSKASNAG